jgi:putative oxidoreductase
MTITTSPTRRPRIDRRVLWTLIRVASAIVFVIFGVGKFVNHADETASFRTYGLPAPGVLSVLIGVVEIFGGIVLVAGPARSLARRLAFAVLAGDMVAAIILFGILRGERVSLTLAPALLVSMLALGAMDLRWPSPAGPRRGTRRDRHSPAQPLRGRLR